MSLIYYIIADNKKIPDKRRRGNDLMLEIFSSVALNAEKELQRIYFCMHRMMLIIIGAYN